MNNEDKLIELLQKSLALNMHRLGASQENIGKAISKKKAWVNSFLKLLPKKRPSD